MTGRTVWFNCCAGVAGDMLLAALVDAGADVDAIADGLAGLGVDGYAVDVRACPALRCRRDMGERRRRRPRPRRPADDDRDDAPLHRPARDVLELIGAADLPDRVRDRALAVYRTLAEVEGEIHGVARRRRRAPRGRRARLDHRRRRRLRRARGPRRRHHRAAARSRSATAPSARPTACCPTRSRPSPRCSPRAGAPTVGIDTTMETATPTGVALMTVLAERFGAIPSMTVTATGFGAGTADPAGRPNVVQAVVGDAADGRLDAPAPDARPDSSRPTSTTSPARCSRTRSPSLLAAGALRRVGDSDRDEEGPARAHRARAVRRRDVRRRQRA